MRPNMLSATLLPTTLALSATTLLTVPMVVATRPAAPAARWAGALALPTCEMIVLRGGISVGIDPATGSGCCITRT